MMRRRGRSAVGATLLLFGVWTLATWLLEGRNETLLSGDAMERAIYAIIGNVFIGVVGTALLLRTLIGRELAAIDTAGFGDRALSPIAIAASVLIGAGIFWIDGPPDLNATVLANAYAQVLVVSTAEILVCWAAAGAAVQRVLRRYGHVTALLGAAIAASVMFGAYHFAHSPPFNTPGTVAMLTLVGLATSTVFLATRSVYAAILFHNFLGVFGVLQALATAGKLDSFAEPRLPLFGMALVTIAALAGAHYWINRPVGREITEGQSGRG